ncbi:MAG TPA: acyl-CoA thioesterase [Candidatus Eisenbacteria bacterium]|jgi:acyl-CoA hydrolase
MVELVLPNDANTMGNVLGGRVLHWIDLAAAIVAHRHARTEAVTASMDEVSFLAPIRVGQLAVISARMTYVGRSSMEIRVDVQSEDLMSGERRQTSTAYLTFVAVDGNGRPAAVPPLLYETEEEKREARAAEARRADRLKAKPSGMTPRETQHR